MQTMEMLHNNNPKIFYIEDQCFRWTFQAKKVRKIVEKHCKEGQVLNLFAGKTLLNVDDLRVDLSNEYNPDMNISAEDAINLLNKHNRKFNTIIYDPPWNERKAKEFYNGNYIGKFTKLKDGVVSLLEDKGIIISAGYEITNFGRIRNMKLTKIFVINPYGEIRPYFITIEKKINQTLPKFMTSK